MNSSAVELAPAGKRRFRNVPRAEVPKMICSLCDSDATVKGMCRKHYQTAWAAAWRAKNGALAKEKKSAWEAGNRARVNAGRRISHQRNKDKENLSSRKHYEKNKDAALERSKRWRGANPERVKAINAKRRARKLGAEGSHTAEQVLRLFEKQCGKCPICHCALAKKFHKDHIVPLALGGSDWIENIQLTCVKCNLQKNAKDPVAFMREKGFLL